MDIICKKNNTNKKRTYLLEYVKRLHVRSVWMASLFIYFSYRHTHEESALFLIQRCHNGRVSRMFSTVADFLWDVHNILKAVGEEQGRLAPTNPRTLRCWPKERLVRLTKKSPLLAKHSNFLCPTLHTKVIRWPRVARVQPSQCPPGGSLLRWQI